MWLWLLSSCVPCESEIGQLQVRLWVDVLSEPVVGTIYISSEVDSVFTKTDEDGTMNIDLPRGEYWIEAEYLPLSCYSKQAVSAIVEECTQSHLEIVLDRCAFLP